MEKTNSFNAAAKFAHVQDKPRFAIYHLPFTIYYKNDGCSSSTRRARATGQGSSQQ
jgi:hypothetical protein